jgi:hypothetical protein
MHKTSDARHALSQARAVTRHTGFFGLGTAVYTRVAQVLFPVTTNTGLYGLSAAALNRLFDFLAQGLFSTGAGIANLVDKIYAKAPVPHVPTNVATGEGLPGIQEKVITNGQSSWTVTAACGNGVFLTGGRYEVTCAATTVSALATPPTAAQLLELASHILSIPSAGVITGRTIVSGGAFAVESAKVTATAVGSTNPSLNYYSASIAPVCQRSSAACTAAAGQPTQGCCDAEGSQGGEASCDCSSCDGTNAGSDSGCAAGCRCYTATSGYTDSNCAPVTIGENFWGCVCKVRAIPYCV